MKKTVSLFLAFVMVLSTFIGAIPYAAATEETATDIKPFYGLGWSPIDETLFPNCDDVITIGVRPTADLEVEFYKDAPTLGTDIDKLLNWVKTEMDKRPEGNRYLHIFNTLSIAGMNPVDIIDLSYGFDKLKIEFTSFLQRYYAMGGKLDGLVLDCEYMRTFAWYVYVREYVEGNTDVYNTIANSQLYQEVIRPDLEARGFKFWPNPSGNKSEIWSIYPYSGDEYIETRRIWDKVMRNHLNNYMTDALFEPFIQYYPNGWVSDYQSADSYGWDKAISGSGSLSYAGGNSVKVGNTSNNNAYGHNPNDEFYATPQGEVIYQTPISYNEAVYEKTPFNMFQWEINGFKRLYNATDTKKITAWLSGYDYHATRADSYCGTPYYTEVALHIGLLNPDPFLLYVYRGDYDTDANYNAAVQVLSELMSELTRVVGAADRTPIAVEETWNYGFILSGMNAGGRNMWRITPDTSLVSVEDFKTVGKYPTFRVNGVTVIFPHGRIIETADISHVGSCGYWIQTPEDVQPVILHDADRYSQYPSFSEDFEGYAANTVITSQVALPETAWEITGSAIVKEANGNKALALTGNAAISNVKLPANITAGDFYAKQQAWEVTVSLPAAMGTDAQIILLSAAGDGGVKMEGGKLWYAQNGAYTELPGVSLSAGSTYTIKRELDFRTDGAFTSNYYVYDANGNLLGSATGAALTGIDLPVASIDISTINVTGDVTVDNYKFYPIGVTADFEVYDATTGVLVADSAQAQAKDGAYRLSWMNAGTAPKSATVMASYYDSANNLLSTNVVAEALMLPGADGVETGIVEVPEGQKVLLSVTYNENPVVDLPVIDNDPNCDHIPSELYIENVVNPGCAAAGSYDEVIYCTDCWAEVSRVTKTIAPTGNHTYGITIAEQYLKTPADSSRSAEYYKSCQVCGQAGEETFLYGHPLQDSEPDTGENPGTVTGITTAIAMPAQTINYTIRTAFGNVQYFVTPDASAGYITSTGANADNWNVKIDNTGATPVVYLKGATLKGFGSNPVISSTHDLKVVVIEESWLSGVIGIRASGGGILTVSSENNAKLHIDVTSTSANDAALATQGGGAIILQELTADLSSSNAAGVIYIAATAETTDIIIKDSVLNIDQTNTSGHGIWTRGGTVTVTNSTLDIDSAGNGIKTELGGVYIAKNSNVNILLHTIGNTYNAIHTGAQEIYISDSTLTAVREATWNNAALIHSTGNIGIANSHVTLVVKNTNLAAAYKFGLFREVPNMIHCTAQASTENAPTEDQLQEYLIGNTNIYQYFVATPTATDPSNPCESVGCRVDAIVIENVVAAGCISVGSYEEVGYCGVCGTEVSRVIHIAEPTGIHSYVQVVADKYLKSPADLDSGAVYYQSCGICGERGAETFVSGNPLGGTPVSQTAISMPTETLNATFRLNHGSVGYYLTPDADVGYITSTGASADNWNVKIDNTGTVPVVYLNAATIKGFGNHVAISATHNLKVVVVSESFISGTVGIRTSNGGILSVSSEGDAKLHIDITSTTANDAALATQGGGAIILKDLVADLTSGNAAGVVYIAATAETTDVIIKDSTLNIVQTSTSGYGIWTKGGDIFISGSTVDIDSAGHGITATAGAVKITDSSLVDIELGTASTGNAICSTGTGIEIVNATVNCTRLNTVFLAGPMMKATAGVFTIANSNVNFAVSNATGTGNIFHSTHLAPTIIDCTAQAASTVGGTLGEYNTSNAPNYKIFVTTVPANN